jgi:hypothetical protein
MKLHLPPDNATAGLLLGAFDEARLHRKIDHRLHLGGDERRKVLGAVKDV